MTTRCQDCGRFARLKLPGCILCGELAPVCWAQCERCLTGDNRTDYVCVKCEPAYCVQIQEQLRKHTEAMKRIQAEQIEALAKATPLLLHALLYGQLVKAPTAQDQRVEFQLLLPQELGKRVQVHELCRCGHPVTQHNERGCKLCACVACPNCGHPRADHGARGCMHCACVVGWELRSVPDA